MIDNLYYSFNAYLRHRFGCRVHRLSLDAGLSCPNIDGTCGRDGCVFCNNRAFNRSAGLAVPLASQIERAMDFARRRYGALKFIAYFQTFSSTYAPTEELRKIYDSIRGYPDIVGLAVSTRPDCVDNEKLDLLASYRPDYEVYLEYGVQSVHDRTLALVNRGHTFACAKSAIIAAVAKGLRVAAHVILGLPGESVDDMHATAVTLADLPLWGIKFHVLHVLRDTALATEYAAGQVHLLTEEEYVDVLIDCLERTPADRVILRLVSDADRDILIAPTWINAKSTVLDRIERRMRERATRQGLLTAGTTSLADGGKA
jgi:radical SAM protein (TIGR01212 family)